MSYYREPDSDSRNKRKVELDLPIMEQNMI